MQIHGRGYQLASQYGPGGLYPSGAQICCDTGVQYAIFCFSFITGSYDRTCKVWDTLSGEELFTLEGHRNVVYAIGYNNPFG